MNFLLWIISIILPHTPPVYEYATNASTFSWKQKKMQLLSLISCIFSYIVNEIENTSAVKEMNAGVLFLGCEDNFAHLFDKRN